MANKVKALQQWCKIQVEGYRDVSVTNMTSSWKSGLAFCAIIHRFRPDLIDYDSLSKENVYDNNKLAFEVAKEKMDIPDLLEAEDMVAMAVPDKLCIVTYVSQYYNTFHSMSPAGGPSERRSAVKRPQPAAPPSPPPDAKRISTETIHKQLQNTSPSQPKRAHTDAKTSSTTKGSLGDTCHLCHKKVYLMERHLEGGKLYHRHCFRESQKSSSRAFCTARSLDKSGKENTAPTLNTSTTKINGTTNGSIPSTMSMAKMWDTKIAESKRASSIQPSSLPVSGASTPRFPSPPSPGTSTPSSVESPADPAREGLPPSEQMPSVSERPWSPQEDNLSARLPQPWSPPAATEKGSSSPRFKIRDASRPSPLRMAPGTLSPSAVSAEEPLSPDAMGLFPHFSMDNQTRNIPSAPVENMDVDTKENSNFSEKQTPQRSWESPTSPNAFVKRNGYGVETEISPRFQPSKPEPPTEAGSFSDTSNRRASAPPSTSLGPDEDGDSVKSGLLRSLFNIRSKHETKRTSEHDSLSPPPQSPTPPSDRSTDTQRLFVSPKATDTSPRSILKSVADSNDTSRVASSSGPKPILKNKETTVTVGDTSPKSSDGKPLRSILKSSFDGESGSSSQETSPRSILKHHDEGDDEHKPASHSILKSVESASSNDTSNESGASAVPRSILKTKDNANSLDSITNEDNTKPFRSILKYRKSSGDSLLSSSGDELSSEEMTPRPILKSSQRVESLVSPTAELKSILKSKTSTQSTAKNDNITRDLPKPILKSRETSPAPVASPLSVPEPTKPNWKKDIHTPTPAFPVRSELDKSPSGPSLLRAQKSDGMPDSSSSFAAFKKSTTAVSYHSNHAEIGGDIPISPMEIELEVDNPTNNMSAFNIEDSIVVAKSNMADHESKGITAATPSKPGLGIATPIAVLSGAENDYGKSQKTSAKPGGPVKKKSDFPPTPENKPEWMIVAEKRQAARAGKYKDPEKAYLTENKTVPESPTKSTGFTKPTSPPPNTRPVPKPRSSCTLPGQNKLGAPKRQSHGVSNTLGGATKVQARKIAPSEETAMEVDDRPMWQIEAEKRQAARKGHYPDPEKAPVKPSNKPKMMQNIDKSGTHGPSYGGHQGVSGLGTKQDRVKNIDYPSRARVTPREKSGRMEIKDNRSKSALLPPPKPLRSPMPSRVSMVDTKLRDQVVRPAPPGSKPARPTSKPIVTSESNRKVSPRSQDLSDLQRRKKSPAPPRPPNSPALTLDKKKIAPDTGFTFNRGEFGMKTERPYAEIGPPTRPPRPHVPDGTGKMANRPLPPVPLHQDMDSPPKRRVHAEARVSQVDIIQQLDELDHHLQTLEQEGRVLEEKIRSESDEAMDEGDLMVQWFELVNQKNDLVRMETDLMYRQRQQELEDQHEEVEYELRCLMEKPDEEKTPSERVREDALLKNLIETVSLRNNIVDSIEEDRIRYLEEDQEIAEMMASKVYNYGFCGKNEDILSKNNIVKSPKRKTSKGKKKEEKKKQKSRVGIKSCVDVQEM